MSKKKLENPRIVNDLEGSRFFPSKEVEIEAKPKLVEPLTSEKKREHIEIMNEKTNEQPLKRSNERRKIRHTFDIYEDQLRNLKKIALEREDLFGERELLGDLVQEALDGFITKERNKE